MGCKPSINKSKKKAPLQKNVQTRLGSIEDKYVERKPSFSNVDIIRQMQSPLPTKMDLIEEENWKDTDLAREYYELIYMLRTDPVGSLRLLDQMKYFVQGGNFKFHKENALQNEQQSKTYRNLVTKFKTLKQKSICLPELILSKGLIISANSIKTDIMRGYLNPRGADGLDPNQRASKNGILIGNACQFTFTGKGTPKQNLIHLILENQQFRHNLLSKGYLKIGVSVGTNEHQECIIVIYLAQEYFESKEQAELWMTKLQNQFIYLLSQVRKDPTSYAASLKQDLPYCKENSLQSPFNEKIEIIGAENALISLIQELKKNTRATQPLVREVTLTQAAHQTAELIFDKNYDYQIIPQITRIGYAPGGKTQLNLEIDLVSTENLLKKVLADPRNQQDQTRQLLLSPRIKIVGLGSLLKKQRHTGIYKSSIHFFFLQSFITYDDPRGKAKIDLFLKQYQLTIFKLINKYRTNLKQLESELEQCRQLLQGSKKVIRRPDSEPIQIEGGIQKINLILETIQLIKEQSKLRPLLWNDGLARSARDHCLEMNEFNYFSRDRKKWGGVEDQLAVYHIKATGSVHECLNPGHWDPEGVVWNWILGNHDKVSGGMRDFDMLFSNEITTIGIGAQPHPTYGETTSAILVGDLI